MFTGNTVITGMTDEEIAKASMHHIMALRLVSVYKNVDYDEETLIDKYAPAIEYIESNYDQIIKKASRSGGLTSKRQGERTETYATSDVTGIVGSDNILKALLGNRMVRCY